MKKILLVVLIIAISLGIGSLISNGVLEQSSTKIRIGAKKEIDSNKENLPEIVFDGTLEICNAKYLEEQTGQWHEITTGTVSPNGSAGISDYSGSYDYGTTDGILWMMTTGMGENIKVRNFFVGKNY